MTISSQTVEKRRFIRFPVRLPLKYRLIQLDLRANALTLDLSEGGVRILTGDFIKSSSPVHLGIELDHSTLNFSGRVAWSRRVPHSDSYQAGIEFTNPAAENLTDLRAFLQFRRKKERSFEFRQDQPSGVQ